MANALQPVLTPGEIVFELERFDLEGDRIELSGRWFGVRGRRFVRPTLTPLDGPRRSRLLADLEHKPWPAEDGGQWEAAFPWDPDRDVTKFELSVSPDIVIQLPSPGGRLDRPRRVTALPRRRSLEPGWRPASDEQLDELPEASPVPTELELTRGELEAIKQQLKAARAEVEAVRAALAERDKELEAARAELAIAVTDREAAARELAALTALRDELAAERDQLYGERHQLATQRDKLADVREHQSSERDQLVAERDSLAAERDKLGAEHQTLRAERDRLRLVLAQLEANLEQATTALDVATRARDDAVAQRGAAIVMRGAARAAPHYEPPRSWWKPTLAVLALLAVVVAVLILTHVI